jgi:hypothetical protein
MPPVSARHLPGDQDVLDAGREAVRIGIRGELLDGGRIEDDQIRIGPPLELAP